MKCNDDEIFFERMEEGANSHSSNTHLQSFSDRMLRSFLKGWVKTNSDRSIIFPRLPIPFHPIPSP